MDDWMTPKCNFKKHTRHDSPWSISTLGLYLPSQNKEHCIVLYCIGGSQFTRCIPLSKREAKIKNQVGFFVFDKFTLQVNLGDESGGL